MLPSSQILILIASALVTEMAVPIDRPFDSRKYLVLDSRVIQRTENAVLRLGQVQKEPQNPLFAEDKPWEPRFDNLYANVIYDPDEAVYRCWYSPFIVDELASETSREKRLDVPYRPKHREMGVCYAVSKDGVCWEKPELGLVEFDGSKQNNLVWRGPHGAGMFRDERERDPARRFKMIMKNDGAMQCAFSRDGLRWSESIPAPEIDAAGDTHNNAFWSPRRGYYVGITRLWDRSLGPSKRIVGRTQSADFTHWTKAVEVLRALPQETTRQIYAMPVFQYADIYLGLAMLIDTDTDTVDCELAWSPDTVDWHRVCPGTPLIPRGSEGAYDSHCIYAAAYPVIEDDEIKLYYGGNNGKHFGWRDGFFCLARLRPDGLAALAPTEPGKPARIVTRPVVCKGKRLRVSADASGGSIRAAVLDEKGFTLESCKPIFADVTDADINWQSGKDLTPFLGKEVQFVFELRDARLYAFGFADSGETSPSTKR